MKTTIYDLPNYALAQEKAYQLIYDAEYTSLPINFKVISKMFSNLEIRTYSWLCKLENKSLEEVCFWAKSDEGCCWYIVEEDRYLILYNDNIKCKQRIRWTIAHELGHFILEHHKIFKDSIISKGYLNDSEYKIFETEANYFAKNLLAPIPVLVRVAKSNKKISSDEINLLCDISKEASKNLIDYLNGISSKGVPMLQIHPYVAKQFDIFIKAYCAVS